MAKERVLITGGAGYLGSVLTKRLLDHDYAVTCVDNLMYGQKSPMLHVHDRNYAFVRGDVRDRDLMGGLVSRVDSVIPLAAIVGMPACKRIPREAKEINHDAVVMLNELRGSNQKMVFPNTNSGYGIGTGEKYCTEETPLNPISLYGITKCQAEAHLLRDEEKDAVTLRLATVFGVSPRMRTDLLVNNFVLNAMREGNLVLYEKDFKRNFVHVQDVARGFEHCLEKFDGMKNKPHNLGLDDANISKLELAKKIKQHIPGLIILDAPLAEDPDKRDYVVSNERIKRTGFVPLVSLDDGIAELIRGFEILLADNPYGNV